MSAPPVSAVGGTPVADAPGVFRAGTLVYSRRQLSWLFVWLLTGDLVFMIVSQIEPRILPILLKNDGASDQQIAWIVGTLVQITQLILNPIYSYASDRTRTRWGRRIPYLMVVTPFVSLFLMLAPYAPEISRFVIRYPLGARLIGVVAAPPAIVMYGVLVFAFSLFYTATSAIYFYLFRDTVPDSHMGRFLALFRIVGALATFVLSYWLFGLGVAYPRKLFLAMALLNLVGFGLMCWLVKEGAYPPPEPIRGESGPWLQRVGRATVVYFRESFSDPLNWWTYLCRLMVYAAMTVSSFVVFFPLQELGMNVDAVGHALAWPSFAWMIVAYPVGILIDRWKIFRVLRYALILQCAGYLLSFFLITGPASFLASSIVTGVLFWAIMLGQFMLGQEVFPALKLGQFFSANVVLQSVIIALVVSPFCGWLFDRLKGTESILHLPMVGALHVGPYRYINLVFCAIYLVSLLGLLRVESTLRNRQERSEFNPAGA